MKTTKKHCVTLKTEDVDRLRTLGDQLKIPFQLSTELQSALQERITRLEELSKKASPE